MIRRISLSYFPNLLKEEDCNLSRLDVSNVSGTEVEGIKVESSDLPAINLFYSKETGYLIKTETYVKFFATGKVCPQEVFYDDYVEVDGYVTPTKVKFIWDGKVSQNYVLTVNLLERLPEEALSKYV
jgi:hypothetical protein